jgi:hypothetical protein
VEGSCEHGNEPSGCIKRWEILHVFSVAFVLLSSSANSTCVPTINEHHFHYVMCTLSFAVTVLRLSVCHCESSFQNWQILETRQRVCHDHYERSVTVIMTQ